MRFGKFYNELFRNVESGSLVVRVREFGGSFEIDFRSHILRRILEHHSYEPILASLAGKLIDPNKDVIDVGSNVGFFTVLASQIIGSRHKVLAIEPTPSGLLLLKKNIRRNSRAHSVIVYGGVAMDRKGSFPLNIIPGMEEYSSIGKELHPCTLNISRQTTIVEGDTIDNLVSRYKLRPGFMKIDVEGAEYQALKGALKTLRKYRPVIVCELSDILLRGFGVHSGMVVRLLTKIGYRVTAIDSPEKGIQEPFIGDILATWEH